MNGEWFPGRHEAIITPEQFAAAHRGRVRGRARGTDLLSGRVRCGLCRRLMALDQNGQGTGSTAATTGARAAPSPAGPTSGCCGPPCWGCGSSATTWNCRPPSAGSSSGPERRPPRPAEGPALAGHVTVSRTWWPSVASCCASTTTTRSGPTCSPRRRRACPCAIREAQREAEDAHVEVARSDDVAQHFDDVARLLATLDVDKTWKAATELERRCPHRRVHRGDFGVTRLPRRESARSASAARPLPGGRDEGVGF